MITYSIIPTELKYPLSLGFGKTSVNIYQKEKKQEKKERGNQVKILDIPKMSDNREFR